MDGEQEDVIKETQEGTIEEAEETVEEVQEETTAEEAEEEANPVPVESDINQQSSNSAIEDLDLPLPQTTSAEAEAQDSSEEIDPTIKTIGFGSFESQENAGESKEEETEIEEETTDVIGDADNEEDQNSYESDPAKYFEDESTIDGENVGDDSNAKKTQFDNETNDTNEEGEGWANRDEFKALLAASAKVSAIKEIPKMRSRFVMSDQQIRDLIDPHNQRAFNEKISKANELLESAQNQFCMEKKQHQGQEGSSEQQEEHSFQLNQGLLEALVYEDELDLPGNFLQQTVGRRLNDKDMPIIAEFLMADTTVARLNFAYNDFADEGFMVLSGVLMSRGDINHINLAHNNASPAGCLLFLQYLMQRPSLHSLKLSGMKIGEEGFNGIICLTMCGRSPYDLDVGETDMTLQDFQGLCSAWEAMDHDLDAPKYLLSHPLPISLRDLAAMKVSNNETERREKNLQYRRSVVELVAKSEHAPSKSHNRKCSGMREITEDIPVGHDPVHNLEDFAGSVLQGRFEIPAKGHLGEPQVLTTLSKTILDDQQLEAEQYAQNSQGLQDTTLVLEEFHKIKESDCLPFDPEGRPIIICPSLYSLDVDDVLEDQPESHRNNPGEKTDHFIPSALDELMDQAALAKLNEKSFRIPDDSMATKAATKIVNRAFQEAGQFASTSDYQEKSDTAQILLGIVLDTCERLREWQDADLEFKEADLEAIWDATTQNALKVIERHVPMTQCTLKYNDAVAFVRKFMETTNRTLLKLLQNPFIPPLLMDVGTKACRETNDKEIKGMYAPTSNANFQNDSNYIRRIVLNFLDGVITKAAHLIGSGDPLSFRKLEESSIQEKLERSKNLCNEIESNIGSVLDDFFFAGSLLAEDAAITVKELKVAEQKVEEPANAFVDELFGQVAKLIIDTEENVRTSGVETEFLALKFPYATHPTRLVLNRPLFQDFVPIMASKMGDYLKTNSSIKCLHMRKWNLGEDGMALLMDGLIFNTTIVLLDLSSNSLGPEGMKPLSTFIKQNPNLKHLLLNHNRIRNPGLRYLTDSLKTSNVIFLNIAYNDISDEALDPFLTILPESQIRSLYFIGNFFCQRTWEITKELFDSEWLIPDLCDITLQEVDGKGLVVKNSQIRDTNEWYDCQPVVADGLRRAPYFEETAHILAANLD